MTGLLERRRAAASARREYLKLRNDWLASKRRVFTSLYIIALGIVAASLLIAYGHFLVWVAGVCAGGAVMFVIAARNAPPGWADNWQRGAWGEQRTANVLAPLLASGWSVVHGIESERFNIDHVLVGPGGVFVLDSRNLNGTQHIVGDDLVATRPDGRPGAKDTHVAVRMRRYGREMHELVLQRCEIDTWVTGVVVLWADFPTQMFDGNHMTFVHGDHLCEWLAEQPERLDAEQIQAVVAAVTYDR